jgi:hypothetical protein
LPASVPAIKEARDSQRASVLLNAIGYFYGTVMFLLLEKLLPVLSKAFTTSKCDPEFIGTSVSIRVLLAKGTPL